VLTIHNAGYQGWFPPRTMETLLLPWDMFTFHQAGAERYAEFPEGRNPLRGRADHRQPQIRRRRYRTAEFGNGLESVLQQRGGDLFGILNGVD